jgi:hypothetical protein
MTSKTEPRSGIQYGWTLGESNWNTGMDANLLFLGRFGVHLSVKNSTTTAPPATPAAGDSYLVAAAATDAWAGKDGQLAIWDGAAWQFGVPRNGWMCVDEGAGTLRTYLAGAWTAGIAL